MCKASWETSKCRVTRTHFIKTKKKKNPNTAQRRDRLQRALGPRGDSGQVSGRINCENEAKKLKGDETLRGTRLDLTQEV